MSLITPDFGLLFWMTLIFAIVFFILAKFGFPVITGMVDKRNAFIEKSLSDAREAEVRLQNVSLEQEQLIDEARKEQVRIIDEATAAREIIVAKANDRARQEASKVMEEARERIQAEKESAMNEVRREVASLSVSVAEKILRRSLESPECQDALVEAFIDEATADANKNS